MTLNGTVALGGSGTVALGGSGVFVCGSTSLLLVEAELDFHCRKRQLGMCMGLCGQWFGSSPASQMVKVSVSFLSLAILFRLLFSSSPPSQIKTFPLVNTE